MPPVEATVTTAASAMTATRVEDIPDFVEHYLSEPANTTKLTAYARRRFGIDADEARDLIQETAYEVLRQSRLIHRPEGFLFQVFHRRCCHFLARQKRREATFLPAPDQVDETELKSRFGGEIGTRDSDELLRRLNLRRAFASASTVCRQILRAYYVEGCSLKESADHASIAHSGAWRTIDRCLKKLKTCLA